MNSFEAIAARIILKLHLHIGKLYGSYCISINNMVVVEEKQEVHGPSRAVIGLA
ncbi:unnamed protein product [Amoebophrya sp. A25]|nr:unnamed protein product [Amoebophrya sp. A25]|eukprot:GSA25T00016518001.1